MPTAVPMMAASASGLSITRWEPNFRWRSSVTRKTPPSTPTSSPRISTSGSRSISCRSARLSAFTMLSLVMGVMYRSSSSPPTVGGLPQAAEAKERVGCRRRLEAPHGLRELLVHPLLAPVVQEVLLLEVGAEARERVLLLPRRHLLLGPILSGIVRGRVDAKAVRHALDQRRTLTGARPLDRLARGRVDREHVVAVHLDPGQAVGERLLGDRLR